jgi:hypothetical protein
MIATLKAFLSRLRGGSLQRGDLGGQNGGVENTDAMSVSGMRDSDPSGQLGSYSFPPNYVPPVDEGRPRH